ncbi:MULTISPECIES: NAD kinase [Leuconostoc]|uniref:NAD kinase n=1 Tax=Leuconostoc suionicum TaxID=1511761 RepID=A0A2N9K990_9LACO|nr:MULTISPECIES: NAD kinase [Leuconostoc]AET30077.1 NAD kinase [Leuconostoc mesenteroides subsp. mesenteroides J18]AQU49065.1 NAD kinase [Leuconostoc mesenteroides subsp. mesenteroides]MBS1007733.1 NAD kinase [Leuconostoc suionicum]MCT4376383.1 NAD kinase [Leuconostoc suionicum]MCT4402496.1 NAD kinase [Leuconostoc suionicum]
MKIAIFNNHAEHSVIIAKKLILAMKKNNVDIDDRNPDIVVSVGGDGTLLGAFQKYVDQTESVRFVGLHTGHLGFYTDWLSTELDQFVDSLIHDNGQKVSYPLLELTVVRTSGESYKFLALNEAVIKQPIGTLVADIYLGGQAFERFRGDGIAVATPTGSTAYNKANGGAVLHPSLPAIQMSEIASINNRVFRTLGSPLIVPQDQEIVMKPKSDHFLVMYDQEEIKGHNITELRFKVSEKSVHFAQYRHVDFWRRVQNAFISEIE